MTEKYLVFHVEGGLGKNVASTAVITHLKKKYNDRKIVVVASYPEVFLNNENIHRVYKVGATPYFYDDYIHKKDTIVLRKEPYYENNHIMRKTPLYETWFNMYDIPYDKKEINPYLPMNGMQEIWTKEWQRQKPVLLLQTNGGPLDENMQPNAYAWTRDMPLAVAEIIVKAAAQKYHIIRVCRSNSYHLEGVERVDAPLNNFQLFSLVRASQKRALIDSSLHHAAAAYKIPCTVLWVGTHPEMFGYDIHDNICAREPSGNVKRVDSYIFDYDFHGNHHEFPYYSNDVIFNSEEILNSLAL